MPSIEQCQNDIVRYRALKSNLNSITTILSSAIQDAGNLNTEIKSKYLINNNPAPISSGVTSLRNDMKGTRDYLNNTVKPAIDSAINDLQREKDRLEQIERERREREEREKEERERLEREERERAEGNR